METKHTPGPWHTGVRPGPIIYGPRGEQVADLLADLLPAGENQANARLIAAAPDLLAALEAVVAITESEDAHLANFGQFEMARTVIAKAKGAA